MIIPSDRVPLRDSQLSLDISGVAGFFGGDVAVSAMATVHIYDTRKWLGWYNMPGSYEIAKRYGQLAQHRFWSGLYPGGKGDPAVLFGLDGTPGPKYRAIHSGTIMSHTGHVAHLFFQECKDLKLTEQQHRGVRTTEHYDISIVALHNEPEQELHPRMDKFSTVTATSLLSLIPIIASTASTVACAMSRDWFCFSMIVLGMVSNGISCCVIGLGDLKFTHPRPAPGAPPGDGILTDGGNQIVVVRGPEGAVNPLTRGKFSLTYKSESKYHDIGISSMLLTVQFLAQLLVVPQGTIFGQIMFLSSLAVSWIYNTYLSSLDKEDVQRKLLQNDVLVGPSMRKFRVGTRTAMAVFVLLVLSTPLGSDSVRPAESQLRNMLDDLLPNDTPAWRSWKEVICSKVVKHAYRYDLGDPLAFRPAPDQKAECMDKDMELLDTLYHDAQAAASAYNEYRDLFFQEKVGVDIDENAECDDDDNHTMVERPVDVQDIV